MITLATLPQATPQQVFDQSALHLITQNCKSHEDEKCLYRGPNNTKCAVGCFLTTEEAANLEEMSWEYLLERGQVPSNHFDLLSKLQGIHDCRPVSEWKIKLIELAEEEGLSAAVLNA